MLNTVYFYIWHPWRVKTSTIHKLSPNGFIAIFRKSVGIFFYSPSLEKLLKYKFGLNVLKYMLNSGKLSKSWIVSLIKITYRNALICFPWRIIMLTIYPVGLVQIENNRIILGTYNKAIRYKRYKPKVWENIFSILIWF